MAKTDEINFYDLVSVNTINVEVSDAKLFTFKRFDLADNLSLTSKLEWKDVQTIVENYNKLITDLRDETFKENCIAAYKNSIIEETLDPQSIHDKFLSLVEKVQTQKDKDKKTIEGLEQEIDEIKKPFWNKNKKNLKKQIQILKGVYDKTKVINASYKDPLKRSGIISKKSCLNLFKYIQNGVDTLYNSIAKILSTICKFIKGNKKYFVPKFNKEIKQINEFMHLKNKKSILGSKTVIENAAKYKEGDYITNEHFDNVSEIGTDNAPETFDLSSLTTGKDSEIKKQFENNCSVIKKKLGAATAALSAYFKNNEIEDPDLIKTLTFIMKLSFYTKFCENNEKNKPLTTKNYNNTIFAGIVSSIVGAAILSAVCSTLASAIIIVTGGFAAGIIAAAIGVILLFGGMSVATKGFVKGERLNASLDSGAYDIKIRGQTQ